MVERLFLAVSQGCLRFVIVVFPDHTHYFLGYNKGRNREKHPFDRALIRIRTKIVKKEHTIFRRALFKIRAKIEKSTLCDRAWVRIRAIIE